MNICVITDNAFLYERFLELIHDPQYADHRFDFYYSSSNRYFDTAFGSEAFQPIRLKNENQDFFDGYDLFFSLHCKQIFPANLVNSHRCINIHPGFNPYNRGWYPQVFSILNKKPVGVTIHEMDEQLDHGAIIVQREVPIFSWDTSYDVYTRIQQLEVSLLKEYLPVLLSGDYQARKPDQEGNMNQMDDFLTMCRLDLTQTVTWQEAIDLLRAMSFKGYKNAYFYDSHGNKVYVDIQLSLDPSAKQE